MSIPSNPFPPADLRARPSPAPGRRMLAVPDCVESSTTIITEAGSDAEPIASLSNLNGSPTITVFTGGDEDETITSIHHIMTKGRDEWEVQSQNRQNLELITATKKRSHVFEISSSGGAQGTLNFRLASPGKKSKKYDLFEVRDGQEILCCTIAVESKHAWSYKITCEPGADDVIALLSFWLVAMSNIQPEPRSPRSLFGFRGRSHEKNYLAMQTVA